MKKLLTNPNTGIGFILIICLFLAYQVRLFKIDNPVADWHSWRQADTSSVSRYFVKHGIDILHPHYDDISTIPSMRNNPTGIRFVEFPLYNVCQAILAKTYPSKSLEYWGRMVSVLASLSCSLFVFGLGKRLGGLAFGFFSFLIFLFLPFNIYYSRTILPEPMLLLFSLLTLYCFHKALSHYTVKPALAYLFFCISAVFCALALLLKPFSAFIVVPPLVLFSLERVKQFMAKPLRTLFLVIGFSCLCLGPLFAWRWWAGHFPEGIPGNLWLFNYLGIRLRPAWWRWLFFERLSKLMLGGWGTVLLVLGLIPKIKSASDRFVISLGIGAFLYLVVVASGNIQHDYYQTLLVPFLAFALARGTIWLWHNRKLFVGYFTVPLLLVTLYLFSFGFSWYQIKDFYNVNNWNMVKAGKYADSVLPPNAKVVAPYGGDTAFLYQTNRQGWPFMTHDINELVNRGATHYISTSYDTNTRDIMARFEAIEENPDFVLVDLTKRK